MNIHPVCFVDTETLGLDADHHPIWEIALIEPDGTEHCCQVAVTQREIALAHPKALEIGRFEERYNEHEALDPEEAAEWVWTHLPVGVHLAGAVVSFDEERLRRLLWKHDVFIPWHYHLIDVEALAVGYIAGREEHERGNMPPVVPPWKSDEITAALGISIPEEDKHTALGDARWAKAIYESVMGS